MTPELIDRFQAASNARATAHQALETAAKAYWRAANDLAAVQFAIHNEAHKHDAQNPSGYSTLIRAAYLSSSTTSGGHTVTNMVEQLDREAALYVLSHEAGLLDIIIGAKK